MSYDADEIRRKFFERLESREGYPVWRRKVGGKEPDGKPTRIGAWTFETRMVRDIVLDYVDGRVLNACAGETKLSDYKRGVEFVRNDINESKDADHHYDVRILDWMLEWEQFDAVIFDPPFDPGRAAKLYEGWQASEYTATRKALANLVKPGGVVVELGWNTYALGDADGWERVAWYDYPQAPFKGDVHLTVDRKVNQPALTDF
jgi:hypothetical protein